MSSQHEPKGHEDIHRYFILYSMRWLKEEEEAIGITPYLPYQEISAKFNHLEQENNSCCKKMAKHLKKVINALVIG
ncbi:hypothetical protein AVI53_16320 (plasmid) [Piscirickettsia salmonis]|uniref:hypothetical protein n=2 Tax=Piscirickettsia salmonis TaxID=1238 RepID=UPI00056AEEE4|nr:hypothetical protein [Piscirickettsia salmonis]ALT18873.1 hypothetical protein PSLF89_08530 [Piscirickettsia salmonis LF-89 = ATCC VR-1361]ALY04481.1 hypothetical protein AWE47_16340 [Piscirickettsia salmonis]AMA43947.1 hypothetical protein AWJ11_16305 [Piscirickettsia salmonis]AOS37176.1 hypothetical protein AVM72_17685 [Piscirickettsia salmonis]APS62127.1 hypothetical protein AVI53_16320 [Piscirickettsia salmonis]